MSSDRYALVQATSREEWETLHDIRRTELFARKKGVIYDANHPDDHRADHVPLVLKLNGTVIGTARLDLFGKEKAAIRLVAIGKGEQRKGHGRVLEQMLENLARSKGVEKLYVNANPTAVGYYEKLGFIRDSWDEPLGPRSGISADCVQMIKVI